MRTETLISCKTDGLFTPQDVARDIVAYLTHLEKSAGLHITFHCLDAELAPYMHILGQYNIHRHPYCLMVKSCRQAWDHCIARQSRVCGACRDGPIFGMCYAGVEEYVCPVFPGENRGFLCVGGYGTDREKAVPRIRAAAAAYGLDYPELLAVYEQTMPTKAPPPAELEALTRPVCDMLRLIRLLSPYRGEMPVAEDTDGVFSTILAYIHHNYHTAVTARMLAAHCHCSVSYISHFFRRRSGYSLCGYVNRLRMEEAAMLLRETRLPVQRVAELAGFSDANYFIDRFKKFSGSPPGRYRRQFDGNALFELPQT